jgi:hypothetical protein
VLHLPALAESAKDPLGRQIGKALWPSHYPVEALEAIRADVGPRVFQTLYQGNASASQGTIFKRDWFRHYQQLPENFTKIVQSWDTAFKTGATNDYSVCARLAIQFIVKFPVIEIHTSPVSAVGSIGRCNTIWYKGVFNGGVYDPIETVWAFGGAEERHVASLEGGTVVA